MLNEKVLINGWINKKDIVWMSEYFAKPKSLGEVKVEMQQGLIHHPLLKKLI